MGPQSFRAVAFRVFCSPIRVFLLYYSIFVALIASIGLTMAIIKLFVLVASLIFHSLRSLDVMTCWNWMRLSGPEATIATLSFSDFNRLGGEIPDSKVKRLVCIYSHDSSGCIGSTVPRDAGVWVENSNTSGDCCEVNGRLAYRRYDALWQRFYKNWPIVCLFDFSFTVNRMLLQSFYV